MDFTAYKAKKHRLSDLLQKKFANPWVKHTESILEVGVRGHPPTSV